MSIFENFFNISNFSKIGIEAKFFFDFLVFGLSKVKMAYFRQNASKKFKIFFWSLRMAQGTIKITKNLNPPCWTFMTL
jgi:hypothetical protein